MRGKPQLNAADVERGLKALGFTKRKQKSTAHVQWVHEDFKGCFRKVTVDKHLEPFSETLIASMANQTGLSKRAFYGACSKQGAKSAKRNLLGWLKAND